MKAIHKEVSAMKATQKAHKRPLKHVLYSFKDNAKDGEAHNM